MRMMQVEQDGMGPPYVLQAQVMVEVDNCPVSMEDDTGAAYSAEATCPQRSGKTRGWTSVI